MIKNVLNLDHNQNFASERAHLRRKIGGTKRWGMLSAYRGCCSALLSFNHSIHKWSQVFHKTLPSGEEANLPVVTTVSLRAKMSCLFYTPKKKTKKKQKTWNPTRATSISKIMLVDTFLWVPYEISWGYIQELNKTLPIQICMDI